MSEVMFDIKKMVCGYGTTEVLSVEDMKMDYGKLYFILGKSGVGKSTLLEAIGLMTKTMMPSGNEVTYHTKVGDKINLHEIWNKNNDILSAFRAKHYSFIFQQTNLMRNFTAGENMCFGLMLSGATLDVAKEKVLSVMEKIDLPRQVFDKQISELSGGQRQRLAFVRALTADYDILFGDEPTGNLDEAVAEKLMNVLREELKNNNKTGVIVSHSIPLALAYADEILYIKETYTGDYRHGVYLPEYTLIKNGTVWQDRNGKEVNYPVEVLRSVID